MVEVILERRRPQIYGYAYQAIVSGGGIVPREHGAGAQQATRHQEDEKTQPTGLSPLADIAVAVTEETFTPFLDARSDRWLQHSQDTTLLASLPTL